MKSADDSERQPSDRKFEITFTQPLFSSRWSTQVKILHEELLVHQDEGRLQRLTERRKIVHGAGDTLRMTASELEKFALAFETCWLQFYARVMEEMGAGPSQANAASLLANMPAEIREAADELLQDPDLVSRIRNDLESLGIAGESELGLTAYLIGVSRLLDRPLSGRIHGHTASGKSFILETVFGLFPPEIVLNATQLTSQALFHVPPGTLKHRLIVAGERSRQIDRGSADSTRALREMQASGRLTKLRVARSGHTEMIEQDGPIAFVESTTLQAEQIFDEDLNRCLCLSTDEGSEQTRRILERTAQQFSGQLVAVDRDNIRERQHPGHSPCGPADASAVQGDRPVRRTARQRAERQKTRGEARIPTNPRDDSNGHRALPIPAARRRHSRVDRRRLPDCPAAAG
jgi:hypothetical protein